MGCDCELKARDERERKTLIAVLLVNAFMFAFEVGLGVIAQSTALVADSLDMLADASVYAIGLYAVGRTGALKRNAARLSGIVQIFLAVLVLVDVLRRFVFGSEPISELIIGVGFVALVANVICLRIIAKHRDGGIHMKASLIFSANDVIANIGVIFSGILVLLLDSRFPDLVIGLIISIVVMSGGIRILKETSEDGNKANSTSKKP